MENQMRHLAILLTLVAALTFTAAAAAKRPHTLAAAAALTATYDQGRLSIAGCGYDINLGGVQVVYTHPDQTTETWWVGVWNDDTNGRGCLDTNYIPATASGTWTIDTLQNGQQVAETTTTIP